MSPKMLLFGAGGALGSAIANRLSADGAVVYTAGTTPWGGSATHLDLAYENTCNSDSFSSLPSLDAVVWAQGLNCGDTVETFQPDDLQQLLQGNVLFIASSLQALIKAGKLPAGCRLVVVSSIWQLESRPGKFSYTVSKAALQGLVKSCALDLGPLGILINAVLPGVIDTPMTRTNLSPEQIQAIASQSALGRLPEPADIATAVAFLVSPENRAITGQFLTVDAGFIGLKHA
jgi:3-oxoacyl-[acyl-carrier protein] reductase